MADVPTPSYSSTIEQSYFIEPLSGPKDPASLLDRFPDEIYNKAPQTHFMRFMYTLLGPAGVGWLAKNYLDARLKLVAHGLQSFDFEKFYGDPLRFGRLPAETFDTDPFGLLTKEEWDKIRSQDEGYRNRIIAYLNATRLGTTPEGMELAARSALNHAVAVVENFKYMFDLHTDVPLGLPYYGSTDLLEEFVVIPRREESKSEVQQITFEDSEVAAGSFALRFSGQTTTDLAWDVETADVQSALRSLPAIGDRGVRVAGGPFPNPFIVYFQGPLSNQNVPLITAISLLRDRDGNAKTIEVTTTTGGTSPVDEIAGISDRSSHDLQSAIDYLRPVSSIPTTYPGTGTRTRQNWRKISASSQYTEVIKFITGNQDIVWPEPDEFNWVQGGIENQAPKLQGDLQHHFADYHTPAEIISYTEDALDDADYQSDIEILHNYPNEHIGAYDPAHIRAFPWLADFQIAPETPFRTVNAGSPCPQLPEVTAADGSDSYIGGTLSVAAVQTATSTQTSAPAAWAWWSSSQQVAPQSDFLEIDFGGPKTFNFVEFNISNKPFEVDVFYDLRDAHPQRQYVHVSPFSGHPYPTMVAYNPSSTNPWINYKVFFKDRHNTNVYSRFLRIRFRRRSDVVFRDPITQLQVPYSVDISHLRVGHYANPGAAITYSAHFNPYGVTVG